MSDGRWQTTNDRSDSDALLFDDGDVGDGKSSAPRGKREKRFSVRKYLVWAKREEKREREGKETSLRAQKRERGRRVLIEAAKPA